MIDVKIQEKNRKIRDERLSKNLEELVKELDLREEVKGLLRERLFKNFKLENEELKGMIKNQVLLMAQDSDLLDAAIKRVVEQVVVARVTELAEDYKDEVKESIISNIREYD